MNQFEPFPFWVILSGIAACTIIIAAICFGAGRHSVGKTRLGRAQREIQGLELHIELLKEELQGRNEWGTEVYRERSAEIELLTQRIKVLETELASKRAGKIKL